MDIFMTSICIPLHMWTHLRLITLVGVVATARRIHSCLMAMEMLVQQTPPVSIEVAPNQGSASSKLTARGASPSAIFVRIGSARCVPGIQLAILACVMPLL
jgi:hypothetical protein